MFLVPPAKWQQSFNNANLSLFICSQLLTKNHFFNEIFSFFCTTGKHGQFRYREAWAVQVQLP